MISVMAEQEEFLHLGANLDPKLVERFRVQVRDRKFKKKELLRRFAEWWLDLEPTLQQAFYHDSPQWEPSRISMLLGFDQAAAEDEAAAARDAASSERKKRRRKPKAG